MKTIFAIAFFLLKISYGYSFTLCFQPAEIASSDTTAIQEVIDLFYEVSSFKDIGNADPQSFKQPFTETAVLGSVKEGEPVLRSIGEYVEIRKNMKERGRPTSLVEWELNGKTDVFGNVAHRVSVYTVQLNGQEEPAERGVMFFQLVKSKGQWKIQSLLWQAETDELKIPTEFRGN
jgi:hypothetical protein